MTSKFTIGELKVIAETDHVQCGDAATMAQMLLSAMGNKPTAWKLEGGGAPASATLDESTAYADPLRDVTELYEHPPAQEYPATLPCPVILEPGFRFGKGVSTHLVLRALQNRAERYAELDAMGPEARAEHDAAIAELREKLGFGMPAKTSIQVSLPALPQLGSDAEWYQGFAAGAGSMREGCVAALVTAGVEVLGEVK